MTHRETGYAQILLTIIFLIGYFVVLTSFLKGKAIVDPTWKDTVQALISVLTGGVLLILNYWFARQRSSSSSPETTE
jgi:hypothetical protein